MANSSEVETHVLAGSEKERMRARSEVGRAVGPLFRFTRADRWAVFGKLPEFQDIPHSKSLPSMSEGGLACFHQKVACRLLVVAAGCCGTHRCTVDRIGILARHGMFASFSGPLLHNQNHVAHASIADDSGKK